MEIETGHLYHIKDEFFDKIKDEGLMINHENGHSRPSYLAIKDQNILWFIPLNSKVDKYKDIINKKIQKYGTCKTILIKKIANKEQVILIKNAFPTIEKYVKDKHLMQGKELTILPHIQKEIIQDFKDILSLKRNGLNLFFANIDKIKDIMEHELKEKDAISA